MADSNIELMTGKERKYDEKEGKHHHHRHPSSTASSSSGATAATTTSGLSIATACLFITGEMTGSGVLALPYAVSLAGWLGIVLVVFCAGMSAFTGTVLGRCWIMLLENVNTVNKNCADPYPTIGYHAFGIVGKTIVNISVYFTLFGVCVVLLLISSTNLEQLLNHAGMEFSFCFLVLIIGAVLAPFCWLKSPKDFWPIALMATVTTAIACVLIFARCIIDMQSRRHNFDDATGYNVTNLTSSVPRAGSNRDHVTSLAGAHVTFKSFFIAFGSILFCFGGMAAFPTIQADMRRPKLFPKTVVIAMIAILSMYLPVGSVGYYVFGTDVTPNVFESLERGAMVTSANILITVHIVSAYVIIQNPLSQVLENLFVVEDKFSIRRVMVRSCITALVIFTALSCPKFGHILSLVGGSAITLNTFVFPSVFYCRLCSLHAHEWAQARMPAREWPVHMMIVGVGVVGGVSSTYSAILAILDPKAFAQPCYVDMNAAGAPSSGGH